LDCPVVPGGSGRPASARAAIVDLRLTPRRTTTAIHAKRDAERCGLSKRKGHPLTREDGPDLRIRGALGGIRTPNLLIRSQVLYPLSYERRRAA
jgi:hypothetical protein